MQRLFVGLVLAGTLLAQPFSASAKEEASAMPKVGDVAPNFTLQYFDGTVEELDADAWEEMRARHTDPPEDWSGSMDVEREDYGVDIDDGDRGMWANPLDNFDR